MWQRSRLSSALRATKLEHAVSAGLVLGIGLLVVPIAAGGVNSFTNTSGDSTTESSTNDPIAITEGSVDDPLADLEPVVRWPNLESFQAYQGLGMVGVRADQGWANVGAIKFIFRDTVIFPDEGGRRGRRTFITNPIFGDPFGTGETGWYYVTNVDIMKRKRMRVAARVMDLKADGTVKKRGGRAVEGWRRIFNSDEPAPTEEATPTEEPAPTPEPSGGGQVFATADNSFSIYLNGALVLQDADAGSTLSSWETTESTFTELADGDVIAVTARNFDGPAGLVAQLNLGDGRTFVTDLNWRVTTSTPPSGWMAAGFDDSQWQASAELGVVGSSPWGAMADMPADSVAQWIWAADVGNDQTVSFRYVVGRTIDVQAAPEPDPIEEPAPADEPTTPEEPPTTEDPTAPPPEPDAESTPESGDSTTNSAPVLTQGSGFSWPAPTLSSVGIVGAPGYDAQVIARWDVVPYQEFHNLFEIGVVAFHINGVDRVEFSLDDGPSIAVREMTLNSRTGVWEYSAMLDANTMSDGLHEIRAVAYPKSAGEPRVLGGPIENTPTFVSGEHSIFLSSDAGGSLQNPIRYIDSSKGSDSAGDGTSSNPFATPFRAFQDLQADFGSCDGATVYCYPGIYVWGQVGWPLPTTESRWVTIMPAPGVSRDRVIFNNGDGGGFQLGHIRARDVTFTGAATPIWEIRGRPDDVVWIDRCRAIGPGPQYDRKLYNGRGSVTSFYCTGNEISGWNSGIRTADFYRDNLIYDISGSPFGATHFAVNNECRDFNDPSGFHGDVFHWFNATDEENFIVYGLTVYGFSAQAIFAEARTSWPGRMDEVAIVNTHISKDDGELVAGSWWQKQTNHLLFWNVSLPDQVFRWYLSETGTSVKNLSLRNNVFYAFSLEKSNIPPDADINGNHFVSLSLWQSWQTNGLNETLGDPGFTDPSALNYRPLPGSILSDRVPRSDQVVPGDIDGTSRAEFPLNSTVGPWEK